MTRAEEAITSTTRAIASTVRDVPPLRLEPVPDKLRFSGQGPARPRARGWLGRWRPWLAPVTAAAVVVAVALALVIVRELPSGPAAPSGAQKDAIMNGVPEYYVASMPDDRPGFVIGNTASGAIVGTVQSPSGVLLTAVYGGAADDRTFIVTGNGSNGANAGTQWYLLRITPGSKTAARLVPLPIPVHQPPAGVAISPDGTKLAIALRGTPAVLRVYSTVTGALLRNWSASSGQIMAVTSPPDSWGNPATALRWLPSGTGVVFAWNGKAIRVIPSTARDGNLLASATVSLIGPVVPTTGITVTCDAAQGWEMIFPGIVCPGTWRAPGAPSSSASAPSGGTCPFDQRVTFAFDVAFSLHGDMREHGPVSECSYQVRPGDGAYIGWSNADGSVLIGSLVWDGHTRFGVFRGDSFTPLPAIPAPNTSATGIVLGAVAWLRGGR